MIEACSGDVTSAVVLGHMAFRTFNGQRWHTATAQEVADYTGLTIVQVRRALAVLRELGHIQSRRVDKWNPTLEWNLVLDTEVDLVMHPEVDHESDPEVNHSKEGRTEQEESNGAALPPLPAMEGNTESFALKAPVESRKTRATVMPVGYQPTPAMIAWTKEHCPDIDARREWSSFVNFHEAKGSRFVKWDAAWRTWANKAQGWAEERAKVEKKRGGSQRDVSALWIKQDFGNPLEGIK
jgi:hypothetical protein